MLTGRQQILFDEAYGAYINLRRYCKEYNERIERPVNLENLTPYAVIDLQLHITLFELAMRYEENLTDNEKQFFDNISEDKEELSENVSGYRKFCRNIDRESFEKLGGGGLEQAGKLPWCIQFAFSRDHGENDKYTSYFITTYMTILDAFVCLDTDNSQNKADVIDNYFENLMALAKKGNPMCKDVNNKEILERMRYIKEIETNENEVVKEKSLEDLLAELDKMIGLDGVKDNVKQMLRVIEVRKEMQRRGLQTMDMSLHMVFTGNPGTGKTTVARLLAQIYKKMGVLYKGQLIEADRSMLVAGYIGQTEQKTKEVIDSAMGGVLFIDEAYTLADGDFSEDYGKEVIAVLLKAMEDYRDRFVVIVAGYPDKMHRFLESNPGLQSRFNITINFDDYNPDEMVDIFNYTCEKNGYTMEPECDEMVKEEIFRYCKFKDEDFANGRDVRNYFEKIVRKQNMRIAETYKNLKDVSDYKLVELTVEDVEGVRM